MLPPSPDPDVRPQRGNGLPDFPVELADRCVKCALCLPHCPTYKLTRDESESPRGRIALMIAAAQGELAPDARLAGHLDRCLVCRACESVCPADVPYGQLIDAARAGLAANRLGDSRKLGWLRWLAAGRQRVRLLAWLVWLLDRSGLAAIARTLLKRTLLGRLARMIRRPAMPRALATHAPGAPARGRVYLFTGCMGPVLDNATNAAAIRVLEALGFEVVIPSAQTCCGAIAFHGGHADEAAALAGRNLDAFPGDEPILITASGCGAMLLEYDLLGTELAPLAVRVREIGDFIAAHLAGSALKFAPLSARVLLHTPCTLRNGMRTATGPRRVLEAIPALKIIEARTGCCGAAGSYVLTQPAFSDRLGRQAAMEVESVDLVVTSNVGCAGQFAANLRDLGKAVPVVHPLVLLARQLDTRQDAGAV